MLKPSAESCPAGLTRLAYPIDPKRHTAGARCSLHESPAIPVALSQKGQSRSSEVQKSGSLFIGEDHAANQLATVMLMALVFRPERADL